MPAVSKKQQIAMNLARAVQQGQAPAKPGSPSAQMAKSMEPSALTDFVGPVDKALPQKVAKPMKVKRVGKMVKKERIR